MNEAKRQVSCGHKNSSTVNHNVPHSHTHTGRMWMLELDGGKSESIKDLLFCFQVTFVCMFILFSVAVLLCVLLAIKLVSLWRRGIF